MFRSANICNYIWGDSKLHTLSYSCSILTQTDPPLSGGLIKYQEVPAALLYFTTVVTAIFLSFSLVLLVSNTALKKKKYVY